MFLTVQEAIDLSGKSQTTIHRLCQKHEGSKFIRKERNKYLIDKDFLLEKYPPGSEIEPDIEDNESENFEAKLAAMTDEKEREIASLNAEKIQFQTIISNQEHRIKELEEDMFAQQHELAELIDSNEHLVIEVEAYKQNLISASPEETASEHALPASTFDLDAHKRGVRYTISGITISSMLLIAFVFMMYYLTK